MMTTATNSFGSQATTSAMRFADRVGPEDAEGELQDEEKERELNQACGEVAGPGGAEDAVQSAALDGAVEADLRRNAPSHLKIQRPTIQPSAMIARKMMTFTAIATTLPEKCR